MAWNEGVEIQSGEALHPFDRTRVVIVGSPDWQDRADQREIRRPQQSLLRQIDGDSSEKLA